MTTTETTATATRQSIQLEVRLPGRAWKRIGSWFTERTAYAHLNDIAEGSANREVWYRLATYEDGANYYSGDNPTQVLAIRNGCA